MNLRFHIFVSDVNQGNEDFECTNTGSRFSCVAKKCILEVGCGVVWNS